MRRLLSVVGPAVGLLAAGLAAAEPRQTTSALSWVRLPGAESCIAAPELGTRVEARLGRSAFVSPSAADLSIEGRIERKGARFHAVVSGTRRDGTAIGTRELEGADCRSLDDGLVLVLALMIDPDASLTPPPPAPKEPPPTEVVRERIIIREVHEVRETPAPEKTAPAPSPWGLDGFAEGGLALGRVPGAAPALGAGLTLVPPHFVPLELALGLVPDGSLEDRGRTVRFWSIDGQVRVCPAVVLRPRPRPFALEASACLGLRVGTLTAKGTGFDVNLDGSRGLVDAAAAVRLRATVVGPLFAFASLGLGAPLVRQRIVATGAGGVTETLYERPPVGFDASLGIGVHFFP